MRPHSALRADLSAALIDGGGTSRQLAERIGRPYSNDDRALRDTLRAMRVAGEVHAPRSVRLPGVKRPVPVYERAPAPQQSPAEGWQTLLQAWMRPSVMASDEAMEAAM